MPPRSPWGPTGPGQDALPRFGRGVSCVFARLPEIGGRVHFSGQMIWGCIQIATNGKKEIEINEAIRDREVRLIGADGSQLGVMSGREALRLA